MDLQYSPHVGIGDLFPALFPQLVRRPITQTRGLKGVDAAFSSTNSVGLLGILAEPPSRFARASLCERF